MDFVYSMEPEKTLRLTKKKINIFVRKMENTWPRF